MNQKIVRVLTSSEDLGAMLREHKHGTLSLSDERFFYDQKQSEFMIPDPSLVITKKNLIDSKAEFRKHYKAINKPDVFSKSIRLSWKALLSKAQTLSTTQGLPLDELAIFCIHRYNTDNYCWYLTLEFCHIDGLGPNPVEDKYPLTHLGFFYDLLKEDLLNSQYRIPPPNDDGTTTYDPKYFSNTLYAEDGNTLYNLSARNSQATVVSWRELQQLRDSNFENGFDESLFKLCFTSITSNYTVFGQALVTFPHTLAVHTNYDDIDLLESGNTVVAPPSPPIFQNNAADYQTLCPPNCGVYIWPTHLTLVILNVNITQENP